MTPPTLSFSANQTPRLWPRRELLAAAAAGAAAWGLLPPWTNAAPASSDEAEEEFPVAYAYPRGSEMGAPCRRLDEQKTSLPLRLVWQPAPAWVTAFPTLHFQTSDLAWHRHEGWTTLEAFLERYRHYHPAPVSPDQRSPYFEFTLLYVNRWSHPGRVTDHLREDHGYSEYELRGLSVRQKKHLHAADHEGLVAPGRRPRLDLLARRLHVVMPAELRS